MRNPPVKLLDRVRQSIRLKGYSIRTEKTYASWIKRFILFHGKRHPNEMGMGGEGCTQPFETFGQKEQQLKKSGLTASLKSQNQFITA